RIVYLCDFHAVVATSSSCPRAVLVFLIVFPYIISLPSCVSLRPAHLRCSQSSSPRLWPEEVDDESKPHRLAAAEPLRRGRRRSRPPASPHQGRSRSLHGSVVLGAHARRDRRGHWARSRGAERRRHRQDRGSIRPARANRRGSSSLGGTDLSGVVSHGSRPVIIDRLWQAWFC